MRVLKRRTVSGIHFRHFLTGKNCALGGYLNIAALPPTLIGKKGCSYKQGCLEAPNESQNYNAISGCILSQQILWSVPKLLCLLFISSLKHLPVHKWKFCAAPCGLMSVSKSLLWVKALLWVPGTQSLNISGGKMVAGNTTISSNLPH